MFGLLEKMVLIQSGSTNKEGVDALGRFIKSTFQSNNVSCQVIEQDKYGNHLVVRSLCKGQFDTQILLVGHMDTVFPKDTGFNWYREGNTRCYGPGVIDMKGGLAAGIFALKALDNEKFLTQIPITFIFNSDEEIGSPSSKALVQQEAKKSIFAFVLETGGRNGEIVTGRKGNLSLELKIKGRAGHAAFAGKDKASAIVELAHKIIEFESLNNPHGGISVNVGRVNGGIGPNTVPEHASARIDFRFIKSPDKAYLEKKIAEITQKQNIQNTHSHFVILSGRPPMPVSEKNKKLFQAVQKTAKSIGLSVDEEFRAGVSDANLIAGENTPVVDGLGPIGAMDHSEDEYMIKESLLQRSALLANAIIECWEKYNQGLLF
ncbi:MAG: M20 family metallopeptidase [Deltaproteobacteria bacterium]|nr:M20 family metallopeptidase [Deltaproteobacteria bacterium]MBW1748071.1 M20 family metallopeptidase [Deltaproteobacteria bacterium]MBW1826408.1 M20 family metallopeptidase [Deltaproteobacteria bacterium]MBW1969506.1 M20 family metallopeptidase [Deltaproteobacteria bacterium]MBW2156670.1 M20 family metallopeptidase [Deltaproteobacteria bacterium]